MWVKRRGKQKELSRPFPLNLPLVFADSALRGFTVTMRVGKKRQPFLALSYYRNKGQRRYKYSSFKDLWLPRIVLPCHGAQLGSGSGGILSSTKPSLSEDPKKLLENTETHKHSFTRQQHSQCRPLPFLITLQNDSPSPFCIFACSPACHKGLNSRMQNSLVSPLTYQ